MRIRAAIEGNLEKIMEQELKDATVGVVVGIEQAAQLLKTRLRSQVTRAGMGVGLSKGWRAKAWKNEGLDAAALVYHKSSKIIRAFDEGVTIRPKGRKFLAIPTPDALRMAKRSVGRFGKVTPGTWPKSLPPLRYIARRRGADLLVVDEVRRSKTGRISRAKRTKTGRLGRGASTVIAFYLVRQIRIKKTVDIQGAKDRVRRLLPRLILRNYPTSPMKG